MKTIILGIVLDLPGIHESSLLNQCKHELQFCLSRIQLYQHPILWFHLATPCPFPTLLVFLAHRSPLLPAEFKKQIAETMMKEKLSYRETAQRFEISDHKLVAKWERIDLTESPEGFEVEQRGRGSSGRGFIGRGAATASGE